MNKPNLPSIQFLLQEATTVATESSTPTSNALNNSNTVSHKRRYGHKITKSVSSLPLDLQNLSLQGPENSTVKHPISIKPSPLFSNNNNNIPSLSNEKIPSWMPQNNVNYSIPPASTHDKRKHHASTGNHGRSRSEFSLPPLSSLNDSMTSKSPLLVINSSRTKTHRRAISANTLDFMVPSIPSPHRAKSYSPKEQSLHIHSSINHHQSLEPIIDNHSYKGEGRYSCPYCQKKFSRPSSLRIHTYSHTGEKPFLCTEPGCDRRFSVQSNMRRHLRVHRNNII